MLHLVAEISYNSSRAHVTMPPFQTLAGPACLCACFLVAPAENPRQKLHEDLADVFSDLTLSRCRSKSMQKRLDAVVQHVSRKHSR